MNPNQSITITYQSIFRVLAVVAGLVFLYIIRDVLGLLFVAVILAAAINPIVNWFHRRKVPRGAAILIIYFGGFIIIGSLIAALIPPIQEQLSQIRRNFPVYYEAFSQNLRGSSEGRDGVAQEFQQSLFDLEGTLERFSYDVIGTVADVTGGVFSIFGLLALVFYITLQENGMERFLRAVVPPERRTYAVELFARIQRRLGLWLRGQLLLMLAVGLLTYIVLLITGVKYALLLSLIAGITELIPFLGPIIGAIPAVFVAFGSSLGKAILVALLYVGVQWVENNILTPRVMKRAVGLNPVVVIAAILIGFEFGGVLGGIVAVPVAAALALFIADVYKVEAVEENDMGVWTKKPVEEKNQEARIMNQE